MDTGIVILGAMVAVWVGSALAAWKTKDSSVMLLAAIATITIFVCNPMLK